MIIKKRKSERDLLTKMIYTFDLGTNPVSTYLLGLKKLLMWDREIIIHFMLILEFREEGKDKKYTTLRS